MKKVLTIMLLCLVSAAVLAQTRSKQVEIRVTATSGESLEGQAVTLVHTDYSLTYETLKLDASGKCTVKVYPGNHEVTVDRDGYQSASKTFYADDNAAETEVVSLTLVEKTRTPFSLTTTLDHNSQTGLNTVMLTWNTEGPVFEDDFESYDPFAINFGEWTGIDGDHISAAALTGDYPNRNVQEYAQIINPLAVDPTWWYDYQVLRPLSGKQYVGFIRTSTGEANDDWLISPAMTPGTENILSFMAKAADVYIEKFKVYVTTVTDNPQPSDFVRLDQGNGEEADYKGWKEYRYDLSAYEGKTIKFAIRYVSCANNGGAFMLMVDDVYVGQDSAYTQAKAKRAAKKSPANPNEEFVITKNGEEVAVVDNYSYTFNSLPCGNYTFGIKARYVATESEEVTTTLDIPAENYAHLIIYIEANSIADVNGQTLQLLNKATGETLALQPTDGKVELLSLEKGEYMLNIEEGTFVGYQQTLTFDGDKEMRIALTDLVRDPENISAEVTENDGIFTVDVKWNQVLGFSDSFEEYDDFATGKFGEWTSIDLDQMPVYPIGLGGASNIVSFPGSGTPTMPTAIAPMVFNPYMTVPAMMPTDEAVAAPTGDKTIIFFSPQMSKADKWLISPEVTIFPGFELSVTAKSYSSYYPETIEFCVATDGDQPEDFTTLSVAQNMPSDHWTLYSTPLDDYEGQTVRLAVHYTSYDTFFAQIDDFKVGSSEGTSAYIDYGNIDHFNIFVDGEKVGESKQSEYTITDLSVGQHIIGIQAVYKNAQSAVVEYTITVSGIGEVEVQKNPSQTDVYTASGLMMGRDVNVLPKGIYVVKQGNVTKKVVR